MPPPRRCVNWQPHRQAEPTGDRDESLAISGGRVVNRQLKKSDRTRASVRSAPPALREAPEETKGEEGGAGLKGEVA